MLCEKVQGLAAARAGARLALRAPRTGQDRGSTLRRKIQPVQGKRGQCRVPRPLAPPPASRLGPIPCARRHRSASVIISERAGIQGANEFRWRQCGRC
jgi:hypothetical protein